MNAPIFAFDFSMSKPAMCSNVDGSVNIFVWPSNIDEKSTERLEMCNVNVLNRNLPKIKEKSLNEHELIIEHVERATNLANQINKTINDIISNNDLKKEDAIIANEGFAFSAKGDAALDLSGYKYILMYTLIKDGFKIFKTYSPITIKKTAGCSRKGMGKDDMIKSLANEGHGIHKFIDTIIDNQNALKKKTAFVMCTDDIADSYWCMKTTIEKENPE